LSVVVLLIVLTQKSADYLKVSLEAPGCDMPDWTFRELPMHLGLWRGESTTLDPEIYKATGAKMIVDRLYRDDSQHEISMHTAMFDDPKIGVAHSPMICYQSQGWQKLGMERREVLRLPGNLNLPVSVSKWEHERRGKQIVIYWYQLGEHVLFGRWDLGLKVRWSLAGKPKWPALIKVMMEIPAVEGEDREGVLRDFAEKVAAWENQDAHRYAKGMLGPRPAEGGGSAAR
jgi:EpsI family protein